MNQKKPVVHLTRKLPDSTETRMRELFDARLNDTDTPRTNEELVAMVKEADVLVPTVTDRIDADLIAVAGDQLKLIASFGTGVDHIDLAAAKARGITVTNTPGVLTEDTADVAMALMLAVPRRIAEGDKVTRTGEWTGWAPTGMLGHRINGKRLGIIGMGRIGRAVAHRAHFGFGMEIVFQNRSPVDDGAGVGGRQLASVAEVCAASDFVSLHCAATPETRHILGREALAAMSPSAYVINTARGDVVDEDALVAALESGAIGGAGLDVFQGEPKVNPAIMAAPNTVLLPHLGSATEETRVAMGMKVVENARAFAMGEVLPDKVG